MKLSIQAASTSQTVNIFIQDNSVTTGAGLTGLVFNSAGLTAYYALSRAASVSITLATLAAVTSSYSSGGFKEIDSTNMPGWYRFDIPNAALASGRFVSIHLQGATNMAPLPIEIELTAWNNQDAVRGGLTALPNANAEAAGGLYTRGTGAGQINQPANGSIDANAKTWNGLTTVALPLVPTAAGRTLDVSAGGEAGLDWANIGSPTTAQALSGTSIASSPATLSAGERNSIADALLVRDMSLVSPQPAVDTRNPLNAFRAIRNKTVIAANLLTVYKEDDSTTAWTALLTLSSSAVPVTGVDPT